MIVGAMSLYELISTVQAMARRQKRIVRISDDEWNDWQDMLRNLAAHDPSVSVH